MEIRSHFSLKEHNTFGISAFAKAYTSVSTIQQLREVLAYYYNEEVFLLGGGSNMLLLNDIKRPVVHVNLKGIDLLKQDNEHVFVQAMAGENWHEFVIFCIENNWAGIENMALIPGNVGTSPIQNIGAYGVELKDTFVSCTVMNIKTGDVKTLHLEDCKFGYRESIFKNEALGKYVITSVTFKLTDITKTNDYQLKTSYGAILNELENLQIEPSIQSVAQAVINIRSSKLPDPKVIGNSGSFFKNPIIEKSYYEDLIRMHPSIPHYPVNEKQVKVPAGWLIDQCGFKGQRRGDAGVHDKQALVLVNHGNASGQEIIALAKEIQSMVQNRYGITIETEVNLIQN
ncbi:UDP-N-acetylmuramate dehydrogenase [Nonlabens ulvanivorans]|uniref:UDP-N-acetylenolpyruvoylglucosamine reductase n=1 Tax=Nonlabens ulvanivorans TaxID=906888 RepID=A0A084JYZ0_NONUL|nr:UDP-N-acetylmuramate dehydrogenase [Nonlabens ulvanivorans]KEZ94174.1 UDP-N-acetylenolpyruvoylglucosamine reductase [Nonlabens ulvanivorans]